MEKLWKIEGPYGWINRIYGTEELLEEIRQIVEEEEGEMDESDSITISLDWRNFQSEEELDKQREGLN